MAVGAVKLVGKQRFEPVEQRAALAVERFDATMKTQKQELAETGFKLVVRCTVDDRETEFAARRIRHLASKSIHPGLAEPAGEEIALELAGQSLVFDELPRRSIPDDGSTVR